MGEQKPFLGVNIDFWRFREYSWHREKEEKRPATKKGRKEECPLSSSVVK